MREIVLSLIVILPSMALLPTANAGDYNDCTVHVPFVAVGACVDPAGPSACFDLREGIEGCAGGSNTYVSDAPPDEYHCEDVYTAPDCCPLTLPYSCQGEIKLGCADHYNGPFWQVGTSGSYVTVWVSHWCYYTGCPKFPDYCGFYDRLMYRVPFQTVEL